MNGNRFFRGASPGLTGKNFEIMRQLLQNRAKWQTKRKNMFSAPCSVLRQERKNKNQNQTDDTAAGPTDDTAGPDGA
jgi:hypothetical protein